MRAALVLTAITVAFAAGFTVASARDEAPQSPPEDNEIVGPGFLPAPGWNVVQTGATGPPQAPTAVAANIAIDPGDAAGGLPTRTLSGLKANDIVFYAIFYPVGESEAVDAQFPARELPLQLRDAESGGIEGQPDDVSSQRLVAQVGGYNIDVTVFFGVPSPSAATVEAAREELRRLVAPGCPNNALSVTEEDLDDAEEFMLEWLPAHYKKERPDDLEEIRSDLALAPDAPRGGVARSACGDDVWARTVEVDLELPRVAKYSASLSQLSYFLAKTTDGWIVWFRVH